MAYKRIAEAAESIGVSASTLRAWEIAGRIPRAGRSRSGQRLYSADDLAVIAAAFAPAGEADEAEPLHILDVKEGRTHD